MSHRGITCEVAETASGLATVLVATGTAPVTWRYTRYVAIHPIRTGAMPTDRVHRTTLEYPKEEFATPHASPADRSTRSHKNPRPHWCGGRRRDGGPGCGARGRQRGLAGLRGGAPNHQSAHQAPQVWRAPEGPEGLAAVPVVGGGVRATREHNKPHRCGGCRRVRRARAGFEARHRTK